MSGSCSRSSRSRFLRYATLAALALSAAGCCRLTGIPDQKQFSALSALEGRSVAVVRVYGAPIPALNWIAIHTWVVTKRADEKTFHRWEIWWCPDEGYGVVCPDRAAPGRRIGPTPTYILGELVGEEAEPVVDFVERASPQYPFQNTYNPITGPNSNTYVQWLLDNGGWDLKLQPCAVGADWSPRSGWPDIVLDGEPPPP